MLSYVNEHITMKCQPAFIQIISMELRDALTVALSQHKIFDIARIVHLQSKDVCPLSGKIAVCTLPLVTGNDDDPGSEDLSQVVIT